MNVADRELDLEDWKWKEGEFYRGGRRLKIPSTPRSCSKLPSEAPRVRVQNPNIGVDTSDRLKGWSVDRWEWMGSHLEVGEGKEVQLWEMGGRGDLYAERGEVEMLRGGRVIRRGVFWVDQILCVQKVGSELVVLRLLVQNFRVRKLWVQNFRKTGGRAWDNVLGVHYGHTYIV